MWWALCLLVAYFVYLGGALVHRIVLLCMYPDVSGKVLVIDCYEAREGLFSRMMNWVGGCVYAEKNGAAAVSIRSLDPWKMYTSDGGNVAPLVLKKTVHEFQPGGAQKGTRRRLIPRMGFGDQLWQDHDLLPNWLRTDWPTVQRAFALYGEVDARFHDMADVIWRKYVSAGDFVVGLHWRGTDRNPQTKTAHALLRRAHEIIDMRSSPGARVFVASDEQRFVALCREAFGPLLFTQDM